MSIRLTLGLSLSGLGTGQAVTFDPALYTWVDNSYTGETVDGTFDCPYKTMEAIRLISPNLVGTKATIYVKPGIYKEDFALNKNGYTFVAYGAVTLRGSGSQVLKTYSGCNMTYIGFTIDAEATKATFIEHPYGTVNFVNCAFIAPNTTQCTCLNVQSNNTPVSATFTGCTFTGNYGSGRVFRDLPLAASSKNVELTVTNCIIDVVCGGSILLSNNGSAGTTDITINGCTITKNTGAADFAVYRSGLYSFTNNTFIYGSTINKMILDATPTNLAYSGAITFSGNSVLMGQYGFTSTLDLIKIKPASGLYEVVVDDNTFSSSYDGCFNGAAATCRIVMIDLAKKASVKRNLFDFRSSPADAAGSTTFISVQGAIPLGSALELTGPFIISENIIHSVAANGMVIAAGAQTESLKMNTLPGLVIEKNVIYGRGYHGIAHSGTGNHTIFEAWQDDYIIRHNVIWGCPHGIITEGSNSNTGAVIAYNVIIDCWIYGILCSGDQNAKIIGNTIIHRNFDGDGVGSGGSMIWAGWNYQNYGGELDPETNPAVTGLEIKNNILYAPSRLASNARAIWIYANTTFAAGGCNNNCIHYSYADTIYAYIGATVGGTSYTLTEWLALGYDEDSLIDVPDLTAIGLDVATADVDPRPIAGSNVIGIGAYLGTDYDDAMDIVSVPPSITTKEQPAATEPATDNWTIGAYIR